MLSQKDIIHISVEVIVISSLFLFVNWKNAKLRNEITFVSNRLDRLEQIIASQNEVLARIDPRFRQLPGIDDVSMMANVPFGSLASMMACNTIATQTEPNQVVEVDVGEVAKDVGEVAKDVVKDVAKDAAEAAKDAAEAAAKDVVKDVVKDAAKDVAKDAAKDVTKDVVKDVAKDVGEVAKDAIVDLQDIVENKVDDLDFDQLLEQELDELKNR